MHAYGAACGVERSDMDRYAWMGMGLDKSDCVAKPSMIELEGKELEGGGGRGVYCLG